MKNQILFLCLLTLLSLSACKKDVVNVSQEEPPVIKLGDKLGNVPTDQNDPGNGYQDGVELGFKDAKNRLQNAGFFTTIWILTSYNTVDTQGYMTFQWHNLYDREAYFSWYTIYQQALANAISTEPIAYYRERYKGQQLGASLVTSEALTPQTIGSE